MCRGGWYLKCVFGNFTVRCKGVIFISSALICLLHADSSSFGVVEVFWWMVVVLGAKRNGPRGTRYISRVALRAAHVMSGV